MKGNAYELAINRLESLRRTEDDSFNLALAYESLAEYLQAAKYYREALDKDPGNEVYKKSLARVSR
jgi:tetratricopeptide (TPR) repeat protein